MQNQRTLLIKSARLMAMALLLAGASASQAQVILNLAPETTEVKVGESFQVNLSASIPQSEPVLGWGLDILFDPALLSLTGLQIDPAWTAVPSADGDGLAGALPLAFPPLPGATGEVGLASFTFTALNSGMGSLAIGATAGDLTEGFALETPGQFASFNEPAAEITISAASVPEPSTLALLGLGLAALTRRRNQTVAPR